MRQLFLIRHGKPAATWGEADEDPGLDAQGKAQAEAARDHLLSLPLDQRPNRVVSSPLRRCRETAEPTARALGVDIEIDRRVGEIPTPSNLPAADRAAWLKQVFQGRWQDAKGDMDYVEWRDSVGRSLVDRGGTAVFSHFVAINAVMSHLTGTDQVLSFRPDHASITVLASDGARLCLVAQGPEASTGVL